MSENKMHSIAKVAELTGVEIHTLRYWQKEFGEFLKPERTAGRQRRYSDEDVKMVLSIKYLLRYEGHTFAGAKRKLKERFKGNNPPPKPPAPSGPT